MQASRAFARVGTRWHAMARDGTRWHARIRQRHAGTHGTRGTPGTPGTRPWNMFLGGFLLACAAAALRTGVALGTHPTCAVGSSCTGRMEINIFQLSTRRGNLYRKLTLKMNYQNYFQGSTPRLV